MRTTAGSCACLLVAVALAVPATALGPGFRDCERDPGFRHSASLACEDPSPPPQQAPAAAEVPAAAEPEPISAPLAGELPAPPAPGFARRFLSDEKELWTAPFRVEKKDLRWLVPLGIATGVAFATDRRTSRELSSSEEVRQVSRDVSVLGNGYLSVAVPGAFYLAGRLKHSPRAQQTGWLGLQAVAHTSLMVGVLKVATHRRRPDGSDDGAFGTGIGDSFPSGHAVKSWALAAVIAHQYPERRWVGWTAYGMATAVSASRVTARRHNVSDVLAGGTLGYLVGRHLVRSQQDRGLFGRSLSLEPHAQPSTRSYGLTLRIGK